MYKTLQRDVNIHYFPSTHLLSPWRKGDSHPARQSPPDDKWGPPHLLGPQREALNGRVTVDRRAQLRKVEFPGKIGTDC